MFLRHADITFCSAADWLAPPETHLICPVESDIAIATQSLSACAGGVAAKVAAHAMPIAIATAAGFFIGFPAVFNLRCATVAQVNATGLILARRHFRRDRNVGATLRRR
jgi:hypothetical protein